MKSGWIIVWLLSARQVPLFKCIHPGLSLQLSISARNYTEPPEREIPAPSHRERKPHNRPFKIQLNFDFWSLSQTHSARHRHSALLCSFESNAYENIYLRMPDWYPPPELLQSRWGLNGQLVQLVWWSSRQRNRERETEEEQKEDSSDAPL